MTPATIRSALAMRPFRPFTLRTSGNKCEYRIIDPDLVRVSDDTLTILAAGPDNTTSWVADVDIASVVSLNLGARLTADAMTTSKTADPIPFRTLPEDEG